MSVNIVIYYCASVTLLSLEKIAYLFMIVLSVVTTPQFKNF